jgi:hypothetical protein
VPAACEQVLEAFLESIGLCLIFLTLLGIAFAIVCFFVWITQIAHDAVEAAFKGKWLGCHCSACTGTDDYARMTDHPTKPKKGQAGWMWTLRIRSMPPEVFLTQNEKGDKGWRLSNGTDLWSVVGSKELKTWAKTKGVQNSFDRRQRSKSIGHVERNLPAGRKAQKAWEARRRQTKALQASLAGMPQLQPRLPPYQPQPQPQPSPIPPPRYEP